MGWAFCKNGAEKKYIQILVTKPLGESIFERTKLRGHDDI
jgi:hypothetical protein